MPPTPDSPQLTGLGRPDEVAAVVAWVISDAASCVHGVTLAVDGGITGTRAG